MSLTVIDKRGDVVLVLGIEEDEESRLLVSSRVLSLASPVFEAMFNSGFAESWGLSSNSPKEVPLPGDDPECMLWFCLIAHMQFTDLPDRPDPDDFANFAVLCNKYTCVPAVQPWCKIWAMGFLETSYVDDLETLLFATYVLDLAEEFYKLTVELVRYRTLYIDTDRACHRHNLVPLEVFSQLYDCKQFYHHEMSKIAYECYPFAKIAKSTKHHCSLSLASCFSAFERIGAWQLHKMSIQQYLDRAGNFQVNNIDYEIAGEGACEFKCEKKLGFVRRELLSRLGALIDSIDGVCLDCVNRPKGHGGNIVCRVKHGELLWQSEKSSA
ncbi:hypothetical protein B0J11DRAFT_309076 [Dendryphion nanum]|uniref:BTB domain-containing protein n=1 Tax=Dendryphion nanum TaxID=256645 RepID=A0A9P9DUM2_9PLEO|nr:hypothetical protein B0J11DRAFT_309076 [Dendryphion nanum]